MYDPPFSPLSKTRKVNKSPILLRKFRGTAFGDLNPTFMTKFHLYPALTGMAFLLNRTSISHLRLQPQVTTTVDSFAISRRGIHVEPGSREKTLLADEPALKRFKSHKNSVRHLKKFGDFLTIVVVAGCCYEIYVKAATRKAVGEKAK